MDTRKAWADPDPSAPFASLVVLADEAGNATPLAGHGTRRMYEWHDCRCDQCRAWRAGYARRRREAAKAS